MVRSHPYWLPEYGLSESIRKIIEIVISENSERKKDNLIQIDNNDNDNNDENINKELEEEDIDNMNQNQNDIKEDFIATSSNNLVSENSNTSPNKTENIHSEINNFLSKNRNDIEEKPDSQLYFHFWNNKSEELFYFNHSNKISHCPFIEEKNDCFYSRKYFSYINMF